MYLLCGFELATKPEALNRQVPRSPAGDSPGDRRGGLRSLRLAVSSTSFDPKPPALNSKPYLEAHGT